jgi:hypothetical protein
VKGRATTTRNVRGSQQLRFIPASSAYRSTSFAERAAPSRSNAHTTHPPTHTCYLRLCCTVWFGLVWFGLPRYTPQQLWHVWAVARRDSESVKQYKLRE